MRSRSCSRDHIYEHNPIPTYVEKLKERNDRKVVPLRTPHCSLSAKMSHDSKTLKQDQDSDTETLDLELRDRDEESSDDEEDYEEDGQIPEASDAKVRIQRLEDIRTAYTDLRQRHHDSLSRGARREASTDRMITASILTVAQSTLGNISETPEEGPRAYGRFLRYKRFYDLFSYDQEKVLMGKPMSLEEASSFLGAIRCIQLRDDSTETGFRTEGGALIKKVVSLVVSEEWRKTPLLKWDTRQFERERVAFEKCSREYAKEFLDHLSKDCVWTLNRGARFLGSQYVLRELDRRLRRRRAPGDFVDKIIGAVVRRLKTPGPETLTHEKIVDDLQDEVTRQTARSGIPSLREKVLRELTLHIERIKTGKGPSDPTDRDLLAILDAWTFKLAEIATPVPAPASSPASSPASAPVSVPVRVAVAVPAPVSASTH